ncbi:copper amine oxidase N-terminal domain-containing protein [Paenibacillus sp. N1-5-1-14]|uniref:copper amine oxidase N-terminal domain-containing protein n=1 Tax=Paenibacillus radicibacter TaxID=2972488 RepID=UPI0021590A41|nr:copper amine oxidase N-terminal domain-containing protein [Paenibacillus radicibacter]MCR8644344.1 copper amine oxidase N-terminal domain-containing protein [Paenibacillus radicibacter]
MKKFILGFICGIGLTATTAAYAVSSDIIQAQLFPVDIEINGVSKKLGSEYVVLNYMDHAYVPVRFLAENLGLGVRYVDSIPLGKYISIENEPLQADELTKKVWDIKFRLSIGQDQSYVKELLGNPSAERTDDDFQQPAWRYDIVPTNGYQFDAIAIDTLGLETHKVGAQLIINWNKDDKIDRIQLMYSFPKTNQILLYLLNPDGTTNEAAYE